MIRRLLFRGPAPRADREATRAEAYTDFLEAQNTALRAELADRDRQLQLGGLLVFYWRARAEEWRVLAERRAAGDETLVIPARWLRRWRDRATEVIR